MQIIYDASLKLLKNNSNILSFTDKVNLADRFNYEFIKYKDSLLGVKTVSVDDKGNVYCVDISFLPQNIINYFLIGNLRNKDIFRKIYYTFENLDGIILHNLSILTDLIHIDYFYFKNLSSLNLKNFLISKGKLSRSVLIKAKKILSPSNLVLKDRILKIYSLLSSKLTRNIYFDDIILSLIPTKYWGQSVFFWKSNLVFNISTFFNEYDDIISLQIPVARSLFLRDLYESLLLQTNQNFKIIVGVDAYNEIEKQKILEIIKYYKNKFINFDYFVNEKNLGVGKTRWKLMQKDKKSKYVVFLDDDVFLDYEAIDNLYRVLRLNENVGLYSIENVDVRYNVDYKNYVFKNRKFEQPGVYTDRKRVDKYPLYVNQEETPVIFNRFYIDLLNEPYHESFDKCSLDLFYNRILSLICGNINISGIYQFNRVGHPMHQTKEKGFLIKEFEYVLYILDRIKYLANLDIDYDIIFKVQELKQNDLFFTKE